MSSYHRIFGEKETALLYAKEAIRTASDFDQVEFLGNGHMLTAMLLKGNRPEASAYHFLKAADIFKALNNHIGYSAMLCNLSSLYKDYGEFELALKYSDDYFTAYQAGEKKDHEDNWMLSNFYEIRSEIMAGMEQYDSAHHYLQLAFDSRLRLIQEENRSEVVQIEAQFNDAQKVQKIRDQAQIIEYEATKRKWGIGIAVLALLFTGVLLCFYFKLRSANHKMRLQSVLIQEKNKELGHNLEQQIMLQGEIHHRVKNNLQVIISLLELQQTDIQDPKTLDQLQSMSNRIYSMAAVHEMLYGKQGGETISLSEYTQKLCEHFKHLVPADQSLQFYLDLDASPLNIETLMPLGIVLNELMTNSLKYASLPWQQLEISMHLQPCADGYCFSYQDNGPGFPEGALVEREGGLGSYLVRSMIRQLNGRVTTSNDNGAVYQIFFKEKNQSKLQNELISDTYS
ncbi:MAG: sensor histidine kinase [Phaeodactylibacter sp.]|nr:sensor histidine kinase [Phaeodactylibacter sp.]